jgi:hypothetical protein
MSTAEVAWMGILAQTGLFCCISVMLTLLAWAFWVWRDRRKQ